MTTSPIGRYRWTICALLFFATTVNYLDRQVLSLLAPDLSREFGWSHSDYANITAVFQFVYAISMLFAGRIIDKLGTKWGYIWAIIIWSVGAIIHAYAVTIGEATNNILALVGIAAVPASVVGFMFARAVLAFGEAGNFPAAIKATAEYFPKKERSFATGIFNSGANVGAILAPLTVPWIAVVWDWQTAFILVGAIGFIWMVLWGIFYDKPEQQRRLGAAEFAYINSDASIHGNANNSSANINNNANINSAARVEKSPQPAVTASYSWFKLLGYRQTWAFTLGKFLTDGVWWFFLFWLPIYLGEQYGLKGTDLMLPLAVLYSMTMFGSIGGGAFPMYFINRGYNAYDGRMRAMLLIALFPLVVLLAQPLGHISFWLPVLLIGVGASAHQAWSANIFTTVSDMFPNHAVASVVGIGGMAGGMSGVVMSKIGGWLFDYYGAQGEIATGYTIMFSLCAVAYLLAWGVMKWLVPRYRPIEDL